ncbi:PH domain-containing protein [Caldibacillus lycopersici]|uniref:PH domain-containing protein n=1 Tax=Perspicuibacillus lycopersici TaxID=1325689 RepID=A0AAE3IVX0_9BACI|nr:PH domain-containing protein [Perspicuibacillus lycopersici]MCU9614361.1 PH domain-containing protein [Perspicuibacillus lycopersici]
MREHPIQYFYHVTQTIKDRLYSFIALIVLLIGTSSKYEHYVERGAFVIGVLVLVYSFFKWKNKTLTFDGKQLIYKEGVFSRKTSIIPLVNLLNISSEDPLLLQILGIKKATLHIVGNDDITFSLGKKNLIALEKAINIRQQSINKEKTTFLKGKRLLAAALDPIKLFSSASILFTLITFLQNLNNYEDSGVIEVFKSITMEDLPQIIVGFILLYLIVLVISYPLSILLVMIQYAGYQIKLEGDAIRILYGIMKRIDRKVPIQQINGILYEQRFGQRFLGYGQLWLMTMEGKILLDVSVQEKNVNSVLEKLLPELKIERFAPPPKRSLLLFEQMPILLSLILVFLYYYFFGYSFFLYFLFIPVFFGWLKWKHESYSELKNNIQIKKWRAGSLKIYSLRKTTIQDMAISTSWLQRKMGVKTILLSQRSEEEVDLYQAENVKI